MQEKPVITSYLVVAEANRWWWALPASFLSGLGFYMLHNTLQINATQMAPERRGAAVAAFASAYFMGQSAGVALAGALISGIGTEGAIVMGAIGVAAVSQIFAWALRKHRREA